MNFQGVKLYKFIITSSLFLVIFSVSADEITQAKNLGKAFNKIAKSSSPTVVFIETELRGSLRSSFSSRSKPFYFPSPHQEKRGGQGSGFVISSEGHIVTNNHVVAGASVVNVTFLDGKKIQAKVLGTDEHTDIALLKVDLDNLPHLKFANSTHAEVGEWVVALGNPFGLSHTLTAGIISATGRNAVGIATYENFIQTDAAINPGNSGGPLINLNGEAVGMNTAIFSRSGGYMGIGFAIPANMVKKIVAQLRSNGSVTRGYLGISIRELKNEKGIFINEVGFNSPAEKSGVRAGDIILKLSGVDIKNLASFRNLVAQSRPGTSIRLEIKRGDQIKNISVSLGKLPQLVSQR